MLDVAVEGVLGMGGTPVAVVEGIWLRCLAGMAGLVEGMRGVVVIAGYEEGNVAMPRQEFLAAEDVPLGALLTFGLRKQGNWHHQELSCTENF